MPLSLMQGQYSNHELSTAHSDSHRVRSDVAQFAEYTSFRPSQPPLAFLAASCPQHMLSVHSFTPEISVTVTPRRTNQSETIGA